MLAAVLRFREKVSEVRDGLPVLGRISLGREFLTFVVCGLRECVDVAKGKADEVE